MKPITLEQYMDPDFYHPESLELAESYIEQLNKMLLANKLKNPIVLEHKLSYYIPPSDRMLTEYAFKYISKIFEDAGWLANYKITNNSYEITISHPKSVLK